MAPARSERLCRPGPACAILKLRNVVPLTMVLLPAVEGMQLVPANPLPTSISIVGLLATSAWYLAGLSGSLVAYQAVPEIVDIVTLAVDDVVTEAVHGSKMVLNCFSSPLPSWPPSLLFGQVHG